MSPPVFRFAPSPNGFLHVGHALSAILNFEMARRLGGRFLLRIEDIDQKRSRREFEEAIFEDLAWLGIEWDAPAERQSEHLDDHLDALTRLDKMELLFASFESRAEIERLVGMRELHGPWPRDPDGAPLYPGTARKMTTAERERRMDAGEHYALRLATDAALARAGVLTWIEEGSGPRGETGSIRAVPQVWGDVVLARKETPTSYHLAVVVDDARQGITHVVRGQDLFWSTSVHRLLQALLDLPAPIYHHHRLILADNGRKLAKSTRATSLRQLRAAGATPADIRWMVGLAEKSE
jgi:glutamyl-Q tRNA(Asp) synthetase